MSLRDKWVSLPSLMAEVKRGQDTQSMRIVYNFGEEATQVNEMVHLILAQNLGEKGEKLDPSND